MLVDGALHRKAVVEPLLDVLHERGDVWDVIDISQLGTADSTSPHLLNSAPHRTDWVIRCHFVTAGAVRALGGQRLVENDTRRRRLRKRKTKLQEAGFTFSVGRPDRIDLWPAFCELHRKAWPSRALSARLRVQLCRVRASGDDLVRPAQGGRLRRATDSGTPHDHGRRLITGCADLPADAERGVIAVHSVAYLDIPRNWPSTTLSCHPIATALFTVEHEGSSSRPGSLDMRRVAANAALILVSVLVACLVGEIMLRLAGIGYGNAPIEASHRLHHVHPASYRFISYDPAGEFGGHEIVYDAEGYRVDERPHPRTLPSSAASNRRIAFLGDSFTEANTVSWRDSFIGRLEQADPGLVTRNFGVSSYAPLQYLIQIRQDVAAFRPTDVVLQLYDNDFDDDHMYLALASSRDLDTVTWIDGGDRNVAITILRYSYLARLLRRGEISLRQLTLYGQDAGPQQPSALSRSKVHWTQGGAPGTQELSLAIVNTIRRETERLGARFYLFIVPDKTLAQRNACCAGDRRSASVAAFARAEAISYIDLAQAFGEQRDQKGLFWQRDIHFSAAGNLVTARAIADRLNLSAP